MPPFPHVPEGFSPETLELLDRAFSETWRELQLGTSVARENEEVALAAIAKSIVELAETGVRESKRLKRHALHAAVHTRLDG